MDVLKSSHADYENSFSLIRKKGPSGGIHRENNWDSYDHAVIYSEYQEFAPREERSYRGCRE